MAKVTLREVAIRAGVAESTVSRALAGSGQISLETQERIVNAAKTVGYEIKNRTKTEQRNSNGIIGVVVAALHNSFYPYLVDRLHNELDDLGYGMVLIIDELTHARANRKLRSLIDQLDGVIVTTATIGSPMVEFLVERKMPTVLAIRSALNPAVDVVESDNFTAGAEAMKHLVELGHTSIGILLGPNNTSTSCSRLDGALSVLSEYLIPLEKDRIINGDFTHGSGYSGLVRLMRGKNPPTAIFCANDVIAVGALEATQKLGIRVPEDLSLIGVDDIPMAAWSMISLTTVRQPIGQIGSKAAELIAARVEGRLDPEPVHHILPTSILQRSTTAPPSDSNTLEQ